MALEPKMQVEKLASVAKNLAVPKKTVFIWPTHRFMGTHAFVLISPLIYRPLFLDENYFFTTYGAYFENFFEKFGTSDFLFLAVARPNFGNLIFSRKHTLIYFRKRIFFVK